MTSFRTAPALLVVLTLLALVSGCSVESVPKWTAEEGELDIVEFATSDYELLPVEILPYTGARFIDVTSPDLLLDDEGVIYFIAPDGKRYDHPVAQQQYALSALNEFEQTGDRNWLDRAVANAERTIERSVDRDGAMWFVYEFDWTYYERTLTAPWYSGMAQGSGLSLFARLATAVPEDSRWADAADAVWLSFSQSYSDKEAWATIVVDGHLWFEEYAGDQPPLLVLNGHVFAMYGLYDYFALTGNVEAARYFDGAATTVLENMPLFRVEGGVAYYCIQEDYCRTPEWQNAGYQGIHIDQLRMLARMTGDAQFDHWADLLESDAPRVD